MTRRHHFILIILGAFLFGIGGWHTLMSIQIADWETASLLSVCAMMVVISLMSLGHRSESPSIRESLHSYLLPIFLWSGMIVASMDLAHTMQLVVLGISSMLYLGDLLVLYGFWRFSDTFDQEYVITMKILTFGLLFSGLYGLTFDPSILTIVQFYGLLGFVTFVGIGTYGHHLNARQKITMYSIACLGSFVMVGTAWLLHYLHISLLQAALTLSIVYGTLIGLLAQWAAHRLTKDHLLEYGGILVFAFVLMYTMSTSGGVL